MPASPSAVLPFENSKVFDHVSDIFSQLPVVDGTEITDTTWKFHGSKANHFITLDFSIFDEEHVQFTQSLSVHYNDETLQLGLSAIAKILWLKAVSGKAVRGAPFNSTFNMIALVFGYLKASNADVLDGSMLVDFYGFCLTQNVTKTGIQRRFTPPSYKGAFDALPLNKISRLLRQIGISGLIGTVSLKKGQEALNEACVSLLDMSLAEYKAGGSFNFLGLDAGRHYIDHCYHLFETHGAFITAIRQTEAKFRQEAKVNPQLTLSRRYTIKVFGGVLSGLTCDEIRQKLTVSEDKVQVSEVLIHRAFRDYYSRALRQFNAYKIDTVNRIVEMCALPDRYDEQEFVRALLFVDCFGEQGKSKQAIYDEYKATLARCEHTWSLSLVDIESRIAHVLDSMDEKLPNTAKGLRQFFKNKISTLPISLSEYHSNGMLYFNAISNMIEEAGITCFAALTGWRASEYGFSQSNINISLNHDPLDNQYTPWRFHVHWKAPKTAGETLLDREITLGSHILTAQLAAMNCAGDNRPAIYQAATDRQLRVSEDCIQLSVKTCWRDFVINYSIFTDIDQWQTLQAKVAPLNATEAAQVTELESQYHFDSSIMKDIAHLKESLRTALPRVDRVLGGKDKAKFHHDVRLYCSGQADPEITQLLDEALSKDTKERLKSGEIALDHASMRAVRVEFLGDALYPTAHAFRHIWAEAVLRRYRGDVGKFIRVHFKHLDERFFMAYIRGKEMKVIHQVAQRHILNSTLRQQIESLSDENRGYAGGIDRFLSKAAHITTVNTPEDSIKLVETIADRVVGVKSNPWATCILIGATEKFAKCSVDGEPQRQNASPRLCLGCMHVNISEGNYRGIVVYTQQDVIACRNTALPWFIKEANVRTVKLALKRVEELQKNSGHVKYNKFITYLKESIRIAEENKGDPE